MLYIFRNRTCKQQYPSTQETKTHREKQDKGWKTKKEKKMKIGKQMYLHVLVFTALARPIVQSEFAVHQPFTSRQ